MIKPCIAIPCAESVDAIAAARELRADLGARARIPGCTCPSPSLTVRAAPAQAPGNLVEVGSAADDAWRRRWCEDAAAWTRAVMGGE